MIKTLSILNFQSHKDSELNFSKGVNVIIGNSDSGKSAIIRALKWLIWNKPTGDAFRSSWGGKTEVEIFTDDAHIVRSKDKDNKYILGDSHFEAFKTDVPSEISQELNMNEINLQQQLDAPFLLSNSPGEVAQHFNRVAHLDKIDTALQNVNKWIREIINDTNYKTSEQEKLIEELKGFEHLEKFEAEVEVLEQQENQLRGLRNSLENLQLKIYDYCENERYMEDYIHLISDEDKVNTVLDLYKQKREKENDFDKLYQWTADWYRVEEGIKHINETISLETQVNQVLELYKDKNTLNLEFTAIRKILLDINYVDISLDKKVVNLKDMEAKFKREMGSVCVLCGSKLK